jgi:CD109 antigen
VFQPRNHTFDILFPRNGLVYVNQTIPDTITSWIVTGFSLSGDYGIGITNEPTRIEVFREFFVKVDLPYSIKAGEHIDLPITVFNYLKQNVQAKVTLDNDKNEFQFVERGAEYKNYQKKEKTISIDAESAQTMTIEIRPLKAGKVTIKITAVATADTSKFEDGLERPLLVEPEGVRIYENKATLFNLRLENDITKTITVDIPQDYVAESIKVSVSAYGKYYCLLNINI